MRMYLRSVFFRKLLVLYSCVLIAPIIIFSIFFYKNLYDASVNKVYNRYENAVATVVNAVNGKFIEFNNLSRDLAYTSWVKKARSNSDVLFREFGSVRRAEIASDIGTMQVMYNIADRIGIYLTNRRIVINSVGWQSEFNFIYGFSGPSTDGYSEFFKHLAMNESFEIQNMKDFFYDAPDNDLVLSQTIDIIPTTRAVVFCRIPGSKIDGLIETQLTSENAGIIIYINNESVYRYGNIDTKGYEIIESEKYIMTERLRYECFFPPASAEVNVLPLLFTVIFISLLSGFTLVLIFTWLTYKPLEQLASRIGNSRNNADVFKSIEQSYGEALNEKKHTEDKLREIAKQNEGIERNIALLNVIHGSFGSDVKKLKEHGISLDEEKIYQTIIIYMPGCTGVKQSDEQNADATVKDLEYYFEDYRARIQFKILNEWPDAYVLIMENGLATVIMEASLENDNDASNRIKLLLSDLGTPVSVSCGTPERGILGISISYQNAMKKPKTLSGEENEEIENINEIFYPSDWEIQLIQKLKSGDEATVKKLLSELRKENDKRELSEYQRFVLLKVFNRTLTRVAAEIRVGLNETRLELPGKMQIFENAQNWDLLIRRAEVISNRVEINKNNDNMRLGMRLLNYVDKNYSDPSLSLLKLSNIFKINPSSVSRYFKRAAELNFVDYLSRLRITNAKRLLSEEGVSITFAGKAVGYDNSLTFRRVFMRFEGMTPTEYMNSKK